MAIVEVSLRGFSNNNAAFAKTEKGKRCFIPSRRSHLKLQQVSLFCVGYIKKVIFIIRRQEQGFEKGT